MRGSAGSDGPQSASQCSRSAPRASSIPRRIERPCRGCARCAARARDGSPSASTRAGRAVRARVVDDEDLVRRRRARRAVACSDASVAAMPGASLYAGTTTERPGLATAAESTASRRGRVGCPPPMERAAAASARARSSRSAGRAGAVAAPPDFAPTQPPPRRARRLCPLPRLRRRPAAGLPPAASCTTSTARCATTPTCEEAGRRATARRLLDLIGAPRAGRAAARRRLRPRAAARRGAPARLRRARARALAHGRRLRARRARARRCARSRVEAFAASRPDERFDVIVLADVIEHLEDPRGRARRLRRGCSRDGGRAVRDHARPVVAARARWPARAGGATSPPTRACSRPHAARAARPRAGSSSPRTSRSCARSRCATGSPGSPSAAAALGGRWRRRRGHAARAPHRLARRSATSAWCSRTGRRACARATARATTAAGRRRVHVVLPAYRAARRSRRSRRRCRWRPPTARCSSTTRARTTTPEVALREGFELLRHAGQPRLRRQPEDVLRAGAARRRRHRRDGARRQPVRPGAGRADGRSRSRPASPTS